MPSSGDPSAATVVEEVDRGMPAVEQYLKAAGSYSVGIADVVRLPPPAAPSRLEVRTGTLSGSASLAPIRGGGEVRLRAAIDPSGAGLTLGPAPEGPIF